MTARTGWIFLVPLAALTGYVFFAFDLAWIGQWQLTLDATTGTTVLTAPVTAAYAAHLALRQTRLAEVVVGTPRGWLVDLRCAGQAAAWSTVVYIVGALAAILTTAVAVHGGPLQLWALVTGPLVFAVAALAGIVAIRVWPHRLMVVLVGPLWFLLGAYGPDAVEGAIRLGPVTGGLAGLEFDPRVTVRQAAFLVGAAVLLAATARMLATRRPRVPSVVIAAVGLGCMVVGGAHLSGDDDDRFRTSGERPTVCAGERPRICVTPSSRRGLAATARAMRSSARELQRIGVDLPDRYEESGPGYRAPATVGDVIFVPDRGPLRPEEAAMNVATVAACPAWRDPKGPPPEAAFDAQRGVVDWMLVRSGHRPSPWSEEEAHWLDRADTETAQDWVRTTAAQLRACELDAVRVPW